MPRKAKPAPKPPVIAAELPDVAGAAQLAKYQEFCKRRGEEIRETWKPGPRVISVERQEKILAAKAMYVSGKSYSKIADALGIPRATAVGWVRSKVVGEVVATPERRAERMKRRCKLNAAKVRQIRTLLANGVRESKIAEKFAVSQVLISTIKLGKTWRHVA